MRHIDQAMVNYLDAKLAPNGLAQHAIDIKDARLVFGLAAEACVGIHESGGNNHGPMVELIQKTIGRAEGESWCMAFIQTMLAYAELKTGIESPVYPSEGCLEVWEKTPIFKRVKVQPLKYAIVVWKHEKSPGHGHTGVVIEPVKDSHLLTLEANTTGDSGVDGIYLKRRDWIRNGDLRTLGFLKPF